MKKQFISILCAALLLASSLALPVRAAPRTHYPIAAEEYMEGDDHRIRKVYQLSLADDPADIPTDDFERDGYVYHLLDITQQNDIGVHTREYTESITQDSTTGDTAAILSQLDAQREVTTEDGYTGILVLDHKSVRVTVKGYQTSTRNLSSNRTYPNLSDADLSLVPKTISEGGRTLTLADVQWSSQYEEDGSQHYTASAKYTGTATSRNATGYTVTADYTGTVAKTNCEVITYTAIFGGVRPEEPKPEDSGLEPVQDQAEESEPIRSEEPEETVEDAADPERETKEAAIPTPVMALSLAGCVGGLSSAVSTAMQIRKKAKEGK